MKGNILIKTKQTIAYTAPKSAASPMPLTQWQTGW